MDSITKLGKSIWELVSSLATETPLTLVVLIILMACYYYFQTRFISYLKSPSVIQRLPSFLQKKLTQPKTDYGKYVSSSILRLLEFALLFVGAIYLAGFLGFSLPSTIDDSETNVFKWVTFNSPNGGFSVDFPIEPKPLDQYFTGLDGKPTTMHHFTAARAGYQFDVLYWEFPTYGLDIEPDFEMLRSAKDGSLRQIRATVVTESAVKNGSLEGIEVYANVPSGDFLRAQYYLVKSRFYSILCVQPRSKYGNGEYHRFFSSFKFY